MASTAIPAYLLARDLWLPRLVTYGVAAITVLVPWVVLSNYIWTEPAAYPAFAWAVLAVYRALVQPSQRRDLWALVAILLATLTRTQFIVLGVVFPAAVVLHEAGYALLSREGRREGLRPLVTRIVRDHRVMWGPSCSARSSCWASPSPAEWIACSAPMGTRSRATSCPRASAAASADTLRCWR